MRATGTFRSGSAAAVAALAVVLGTIGTQAAANSCKNSGDLRYLGNTVGGGNSVWLSTTTAGAFRLEAASGNVTVDAWSRANPGARLSLSPFVSNGSGGVHRLFESGTAPNGGDCLVDTQNQKNGLELPPLPPWVIRPPVVPPVGILPPGGVMPGMPVRPVPPIAVLPPQGLMPGVPGRPVPPIGVVPPGGVMPGVPARPVPPVGVVPPEGLMPGVPARPSPPVGVLPPDGVMPGRPVPPERPITALPSGTWPGTAGAGPALAGACVEDSAGKFGPVLCDPVVVPLGAPLTPGRDLAPPTLWNVWTSLNYTSVSYDIWGSPADIDDVYFAAGADRMIAAGTVVGLQIEVEQTSGTAFGGLVTQDTSTFAIGPYFATTLSEDWTMSGLLTFGSSRKETEILSLAGNYDTPRLRTNLTFSGQYDWGQTIVRPQLALDYLRYFSTDYTLDGTVGATPVSVDATSADSGLGTITPFVDFSRIFVVGDAIVVPYVELGATYAVSQSEGGLFAGGGTTSTQSDISGRVRLGVRGRLSDAFYAEASLGYLSVFQDGVDAVDGGLYLAWSF